jgi:hypothetical protein
VLCESCGNKRTVYEEKETDVHIGAQLVADTAAGIMDDALIISGDADCLPAIRIAQAVSPQMTLIGAFPPGRLSKRIRASVPTTLSIGENKVRQSQLPESVQDDRWSYSRPPKWNKESTEA